MHRRGPASGDKPSLRISRCDLTVLALMTVAAAILRFIHLDSQLWLDEIYTLVDFVRPPIGEIVTSFPSQNQHLLYSVLAWVAVQIFGESAWALRLPAVLFGITSIWATYLLGRRLIGSREVLLACALMTFSYHHIWFSQNARGYSAVLFFAVLATWIWLEALDRRAWSWWAAYSATLLLGCASHLSMLFIPAAHSLIWGFDVLRGHLREPALKWQPLAAWALGGTLFLQVFALSLPEFLRSALGEVSMPSEWTNPLWLVGETVRGLQVGSPGYLAVVAGLTLSVVGWVGVFRRHRRGALAMTIPGFLCAAVILGSGHNLWPRVFFFSMAFALLFLVHGAMALPRLAFRRLPALRIRPGLADQAGLALGVLMILASAATIPRCYALPKQDFVGARDYVESQALPGETVAAVGLAGDAYGAYYAPAWATPQSAAELEALRLSGGRLWLVYTLPFQIQGFHPETWSIIKSSFTVHRAFRGTLGGGEIYVSRERPDGRSEEREHEQSR